MATIKTGYEVPDYSAQSKEPASPMKESDLPKKVVYPDITLRGPCAEALAGAHAAGEEFEVTCKMKLVRVSQTKGATSEWGEGRDDNSVDLEIMSIDHEDIKTGEQEEEDAESAVERYRESKNPAAEEEED